MNYLKRIAIAALLMFSITASAQITVSSDSTETIKYCLVATYEDGVLLGHIEQNGDTQYSHINSSQLT